MSEEVITPAKLTPAFITIPQLAELSGPDPSKGDVFAYLFFVLLEAMSVRQDTVITQSEEIKQNAAMQNKLNQANGDINFSILPEGAKTATINRYQAINEQKSAMREDIQNQLITARQNAQVMMTQTSTNVNILQQDASEDSGWLQTLNTIFQVIDQMTGR